jgi:hypothetical protein
MFGKIFKNIQKFQSIIVQQKAEIVQLGKVSTNTFGKPGGKGEGKRPNVFSMGM